MSDASDDPSAPREKAARPPQLLPYLDAISKVIPGPAFVPPSTIPKQIRAGRRRAKRNTAEDESSEPENVKSVARPTAPNKRLIRAEADREWRGWFQSRGWKPFGYQTESWEAYTAGKSGLILLPTGSGKTYAAMGGPLVDLRSQPDRKVGEQLTVLYLSPLKALVRDLELAIRLPLTELGWNYSVESRTGDTDSATKRRQRESLPHVLLTTPESLALLVTQPGWRDRVKNLRAIVLDEWHELLGSKRGSLLELTLARLRAAAPDARTWAVSATIADPELALEVALGSEPPEGRVIVRSDHRREIVVRAIQPSTPDDLPWFGFSGLSRVPEVIAELDPAQTTLLFTNTRSQAELWFREILRRRPEWERLIGLHHGSIESEERERIERAVKAGTLPFVVATSSLDLGVDFPTVEKVIQIGSVKGVARATQRAGRAFHRPGEKTRLTVVPTHFFEYLEVSALKRAIADGYVEPRTPIPAPLDVLTQFILTSALDEGFLPDDLLADVRAAYSFRSTTDETFSWILDFLTTGGESLRAYPRFQKIVRGTDGRYRFSTPKLERNHRMNIGTIVSEMGINVKYLQGGNIGQVDEGFISKLNKGDVFQFAGKKLELVMIQNRTALVRVAKKKETVATVWGGISLPISPALSKYVRELVAQMARADESLDGLPEEARWLAPLIAIQAQRSTLPGVGETLVERLESREGHHLFVYTWEGKAVNEGLGHLLAYRLSLARPNTIAVSANDQGFECLAVEPFPEDDVILSIFRDADSAAIERDIERSLNSVEMAKRAFREVAAIAGLVQTSLPSERRATHHLQMSTSLLFDVYRKYSPEHPLLREAYREVKRQQLDLPRLERVLSEIAAGTIRFERPDRLTPFAFPLFIERARSRVSSESLSERIERIQKKVFAP